MKNGFGLALIKDDEIVSEAFACYIGGGFAEIGYITSEKYRGKGYVTLAAAFLMRKCLSRGLVPIASCNAENLASARTCQKLGYISKPYQFLVFSQT